jgi:hypothetical protein
VPQEQLKATSTLAALLRERTVRQQQSGSNPALSLSVHLPPRPLLRGM